MASKKMTLVLLFGLSGAYLVNDPDPETCDVDVGQTLDSKCSCCSGMDVAELEQLKNNSAARAGAPSGDFTLTDCNGTAMHLFPHVTACCEAHEPDELQSMIDEFSRRRLQACPVTTSGDILEILAPVNAGYSGTGLCACGDPVAACGCEHNDHVSAWHERTSVTTTQETYVSILTSTDYCPTPTTCMNAGVTQLLPGGPLTFSSGLAPQQNAWGGQLPAGTYDSYFIHGDKQQTLPALFSFSVTFSEQIAAVVYRNRALNGANPSKELYHTDPVFGHPDTTYGADTAGTLTRQGSDRGLELAGGSNTEMTISEDKKTLTVTDMKVHNGMDDIRVITHACAAPMATGC